MCKYYSQPLRVMLALCVMGLVLGGPLKSASASENPEPRYPSKSFVDVTDRAGIRHRHHKPVLDSKLDRIMPWMTLVGASAAAVDYDRDGDIDLYVTDSQQGKANKLFRNKGDGTFTEVAEEAGVARANEAHGASMDAVWGDYDNDGHLDLYVVKWGSNILYHNNGDGTFTDVTDKARVGDRGNGNTAVWFDYNDDGRLDLFVGNYFRYVDLWRLEDSRQMREDVKTARDGGANVLYRGNGDGTFTNVTEETGVGDTGWTLDVGCADYDNDGDQDLVLAGDFGRDQVLRLNADGTFTNVTDKATGWDTNKGMSVDFGDYNNDGWMDLYITNIWTKNYVQGGNQLYRNMGDGTFSDISFEADVYNAGWSWAGRFWDFDNDGDLDLMVANDYISGDRSSEYFTDLTIRVTKPGFDPIDVTNWPTTGHATFAGYEPSRVWRNDSNEVFKELATELGLADIGNGRGLAIADFDEDGDLDVYISKQGLDGVLYRNDIGARNNWLKVNLVGTTCNHYAMGARVTLVSGDVSQIREVNGGNGAHSQCPYRLHFGLGQRTTIDRLEVRWPNGYVQRLTGIKPNQIIKIVEQTPDAYLAERKRWKEAQLKARRLDSEREKSMAEYATKAGAAPPDEEPQEWRDAVGLKREYLNYRVLVQKDPDDPMLRYDFAGLVLDRQGRRMAALRELERAAQLGPDRMHIADKYRTLVRKYGPPYFDRSIRLFEDLAEEYPDVTMVRLNKALAYMDKMPYSKLGIAHEGIVLSNKSLQVLDGILDDDPKCWIAKFMRGMNYLHWPRMLGHAPLAIVDFTELIAMQKTFPEEKQREWGHFALTYVALGDAYVKNRATGLQENLARARQVWEAGITAYPDHPELKQRLELVAQSEKELVAHVEKRRGLENPIYTGLRLFWVAEK